MSFMKHSELMTGDLGCGTVTFYDSTDCTGEKHTASYDVAADASSASEICDAEDDDYWNFEAVYCNKQEGFVVNAYSDSDCEGEPINSYKAPIGTCIDMGDGSA